jgi:ABC-2 type transport system permease protein
MKKIWHIGFNDIRLMVKDKIFFFWVLIFPLLFIFIFGNLFKGDSGNAKASLEVINLDKGKWGNYFIEKLKSPSILLKVLDKEPEQYNRILVIPEDFSQKIMEKKSQALSLKKRSGANIKAAAQAETKIIQAIAKVITELILYGDNDIAAFFQDKPEFKNILQVKAKFPEGTVTRKPWGFDHVIPGVLVQFIMMMVLIYGGVSVMTDRKRGVLTRIMYASTSTVELFGGKFLGRLLMGILQSAILIIVGILFYNLNLGNIFLSFLNVLIFSITIAALSIFIGSVMGKEELIVGISVLSANIFAALGGCWWPIEVVPSTFKTLGMISPAYWAMDAFHQIIFFNKGFADVSLNFIVLLGFTAIFTVLAVKFFKLKD